MSVFEGIAKKQISSNSSLDQKGAEDDNKTKETKFHSALLENSLNQIDILKDNLESNTLEMSTQTQTTSEAFKCQICYCEYNLLKNIPMVISCGHTYCMVCLKKNNSNHCFYCKKFIGGFSKNYSLIQGFNITGNDDYIQQLNSGNKKEPQCPNKHYLISFQITDFRESLQCCFFSKQGVSLK